MGMGEPLYNYEEVKKACLILMDGEGLSLSKRRITLSTSGVVPELKSAAAKRLMLISLYLFTQSIMIRAQRSCRSIKNIPLEELLAACREYPGVSNARRITFEYVMLKGINDPMRTLAV